MRFLARPRPFVAIVLFGVAAVSLASSSLYTLPRRKVPHVQVLSHGRVVFSGTMDLGPTLDRIARGERYPHRNDGSVFANRERRLPKKPNEWYREYVVPTPGEQGPGPQRIIIGREGEAFYTPDHYGTFVPLNERTR